MNKLKIAYILRPNYQIQLSGPVKKRTILIKMLEELCDLTIIQLEDTQFDTKGCKPDILDFTYYAQLLEMNLSSYDYVINERYSILPLLDQLNIRHIFLPHMTWLCDDGFAKDLQKFAPFVDIVICETALIKGLFLPYTKHCFVLENANDKQFRYNHALTEDNNNIIMVGRDDDVKQLYLGIDAFNQAKLPCRLQVYSSIPLCKKTESKKTDHIDIFINKVVDYTKSSILLHTSKHETYGIAIHEAISNGLSVIMPRDLGYDHYDDHFIYKYNHHDHYDKQVQLIADKIKYVYHHQSFNKVEQLEFHIKYSYENIKLKLVSILDQLSIYTETPQQTALDEIVYVQNIYRQLKKTEGKND